MVPAWNIVSPVLGNVESGREVTNELKFSRVSCGWLNQYDSVGFSTGRAAEGYFDFIMSCKVGVKSA